LARNEDSKRLIRFGKETIALNDYYRGEER